ncbi:MAG: hypothetical protein PHT07_15260 [Paludibacter sp.]|nr:hypothetical protein [Paludibacter sp.]
MQQRPDIRTFFEHLFDRYLPAMIVELGTGDGEFIDIICRLIDERTSLYIIHSFDLGRPRTVTNENVIYHDMNIFDNECSIAKLLGYNTLLLCDNGDKIREVKTFAKYLNKSDVIMAHDYAYDRESFHRLNHWRTCEITFADIKDSVQEFRPFYQELMIKAGWLSLIKT